MRAKPGCRKIDMESTGKVAGDVRVGLEMIRQHGQRRLRVGAAAGASLKMGGHQGGRHEPKTARTGV